MKTDANGNDPHGKLFLPALAMSNFASNSISVLIALLLVDIGKTFDTPVGVTGQVNTAFSLAAFAFALLTSVLSIHFKHDSLLVAGLLMVASSAVGCFFAPSFVAMLLFCSLSGAGYAMVTPMALTLVGEYLPLQKRANAIGLIVAAGALVYVVGAPLIALLASIHGWRLPIVAFVLPVSLVSFLLALLGLSLSKKSETSFKASAQSLRGIFPNKSTVACLTGDTLRAIAFVGVAFYATSFFRQRFYLSTDIASLLLVAGAGSYVLGSLSDNFFLVRFGRKKSTVLAALLAGIFTIAYVFPPTVYVSFTLMLAASWFFGVLASCANSLTLEQVPKLRGALMSVDSALLNLGSALGSTIGGVVLLFSSYEGLGSVLGMMSLAAAVVMYVLAKDPTL